MAKKLPRPVRKATRFARFNSRRLRAYLLGERGDERRSS